MALLEGKVAIVTGAAGGLGRGVSTAFAREGASLAVVDVDAAGLRDEAARLTALGCDVMPLTLDLADEEMLLDGVDEILERFGRVDVLVNNAAVNHRLSIVESTREQWNEMVAVNLRAPYVLCQRLLPVMASNGGGSIVNVTSIVGMTAADGGAIYGMTKAGLQALTRQIAVDWGPRRVRCNSIYLGGMSWIMTGGIPALPDVNELPLRRLGASEEFGNAIVFLASDLASYVSGANLPIDGARSLTLMTRGETT